MPFEDRAGRAGFSELLTELSDSDVVVELVGNGDTRKTPDAAPARLVQEAVDAAYQALAGSVTVKLEPVALLEEMAKNSISLWLRVQVGGEGFHTQSPDSSLVKFLARGTLAIIAWMDGSSTHQLADLQQAIRVLAWGTSITTAAQPELPSPSALVEAVSAWQRAKDSAATGTAVRFITNNGSGELDLSKRIQVPRALLFSRKLGHSADLIFVVTTPDYQASGRWPLKFGDRRIDASLEPGTLLDKFYQRELDIRPGDGLRCRVDIETSYGPDHEVLAERYRIREILEVLPAASAAQEKPETPAIPLRPQPGEPTSRVDPA
ncbi:MAG: hypothetical protein HOP91_07455 [Sphingomonas sp.]|nr:hypothetical protein [Sphingomonas sp.]